MEFYLNLKTIAVQFKKPISPEKSSISKLQPTSTDKTTMFRNAILYKKNIVLYFSENSVLLHVKVIKFPTKWVIFTFCARPILGET